jgi:hypothetical protein
MELKTLAFNLNDVEMILDQYNKDNDDNLVLSLEQSKEILLSIEIDDLIETFNNRLYEQIESSANEARLS